MPVADLPDFRVGDIAVTRLVEFEVPAPTDAPVPGWLVEAGFTAGADGVRTSSAALLVCAGGRTIVVDPWLVFDGDPDDDDGLAVRADAVVRALAHAGVAPADVDVVVNTHVDGIGLNVRPSPDGGGRAPMFPRARYLFSTAELALSAEDARLDPLRRAGVIDGVDPPHEVAPGVTLDSGPGHRDGHLIVRLQSGGDAAVIPGHLVISPLQVADPDVALDEDPTTATATRRRLLTELAACGGLLIGSLIGGPGGGRVVADGDAWRLDPAAGG